MTVRRRWFLLLAFVLIVGTARPASAVLFDMVGHWASPLIGALQVRGIISGDENGQFRPEDPLTRAEMAKLLAEGLGRHADADLLAKYASRFSDVTVDHWANGYIEVLAEMAVTEGYPGGTFGPGDEVTRAQMAVFMVRAAGLDEKADQMRFESTTYKDDADLPDWARGAVQVALDAGLMAGFEDHTFRPFQPITRAEGSATLLRVLATKGLAYNLTGTLVAFDAGTLKGVVRDELGQERTFAMSRTAEYFRSGVLVAARQVQVLDQVWIVEGPDGKGRFMEARNAEFVGSDAVVQDGIVRLTAGIQQRSFTLQPGALIFLNGRPARLEQINGSQEVYLALDRQNGQVRVLDAVNTPIEARVVIPVGDDHGLVADVEEGERTFPVAENATILLNGTPVTQEELQPDDRLRLALDETGTIVYLLAER